VVLVLVEPAASSIVNGSVDVTLIDRILFSSTLCEATTKDDIMDNDNTTNIIVVVVVVAVVTVVVMSRWPTDDDK